jgi:hypothetical protein
MPYETTPFQHTLATLDACDEARAWVGEKALAEAWAQCERVDWLHWLTTAAAQRQYDEATAPAQRQYDEATAAARCQLQEARDAAWRQYDEARAAESPCDHYRAHVACPAL